MKIEINLLPGAKKKRGGGVGAGLSLPNLKDVLTQVKDPLLLGAIGAWAAGLTVMGMIWFTEQGRVASLEPQLSAAQREARQFQIMIGEKTRTQVLRDSLEAELAAIRGIDGDRFVWPHIMEEVTRALPQFTWLVSLDALQSQDLILDDGTVVVGPIQFNIDGRAADISGFTRFVTQLQSSPWLTNVRTGQTQSVQEEGRTVTAFQITGTFVMADSAFVRTVPVDQIFGQGG